MSKPNVTDTLRHEITERRESLTRHQREESAARATIEVLERKLAAQRATVTGLQGKISHEQDAIGALEQAVAILTERLPVDPLPPASEEKSESQPEEKKRASQREPLMVHSRQREGDAPGHPGIPRRTVPDIATQLDIDAVNATWRERAELVRDLLADAKEPQRQVQIARDLALLLECKLATAQPIVVQCLAILYREGRVRPDPTSNASIRHTPWELAPSERASAGVGAPLNNFEGETTHWPSRGQQPAEGRISVESGAFEQGRK